MADFYNFLVYWYRYFSKFSTSTLPHRIYPFLQALAFLALVAESYGVWGPFLVITPASTLHNWQQEVARFLPAFTTVPYWGSPQERKVLRSFWNQENLHTKVRD
jgi:SNF2-related domain